ncbi:MAG TPA: peptidylprolyl isomerase, partial [Tepidisphaeraceae bacterium]|nr:peptidylprolyl isomerase [Tepidisphaeraceae bacterium]
SSHARASIQTTIPSRISSIEPLENRTLLSGAEVTSVLADNRGEVIITLNAQVDFATVNKTSVQVYSPGPDGILGNADDARVPASVRWTDTGNRITIEGQIAADTPYRVKLVASRMRDDDGTPIDGDFFGSFPSGDHHGGGNFEFQVKSDKSATPLVRMSTTAGVITLALLRAQKPISVANFLSYANAGDYDGIFFTRSVADFVIQAGSLQVADDNTIQPVPVGAPIQNEFDDNGTVSNTRGTVAFAKQPPPQGQPPTDDTINSATNQFFFNLADNGADSGRSNDLDDQNGGFTVFAQIASVSGLSTMDNIAGYDTVALNNPVTGDGVIPPIDGTDLTNTPVQDRSLLSVNLENVSASNVPQFQYVATDGLNPMRDLIMVRRTALLMRVAPLTPVQNTISPTQ